MRYLFTTNELLQHDCPWAVGPPNPEVVSNDVNKGTFYCKPCFFFSELCRRQRMERYPKRYSLNSTISLISSTGLSKPHILEVQTHTTDLFSLENSDTPCSVGPFTMVSCIIQRRPAPARFDNPDLCWLQWPASHSCWRHCTWGWLGMGSFGMSCWYLVNWLVHPYISRLSTSPK